MDRIRLWQVVGARSTPACPAGNANPGPESRGRRCRPPAQRGPPGDERPASPPVAPSPWPLKACAGRAKAAVGLRARGNQCSSRLPVALAAGGATGCRRPHGLPGWRYAASQPCTRPRVGTGPCLAPSRNHDGGQPPNAAMPALARPSWPQKNSVWTISCGGCSNRATKRITGKTHVP